MIAVDIETHDPNIETMGDGSIRKDGHVICVGLYDGADAVCVTPTDPRLEAWLASDEDKVFHNGMYDLAWLVLNLGLKVNGVCHDTMTRAALINEYMDLKLDACCEHFGVVGKNKEDTIEAWAKEHGVKGVMKHLADLWQFEKGREAVEKYCIQDCVATYNLFHVQEPHMANLRKPYTMECKLQPLLLQMRKQGVRLDVNARDALTVEIEGKSAEIWGRLKQYGLTQEVARSSTKMGTLMGILGIESPVKTGGGKSSWSALALDMIDHPLIEDLKQAKLYQNMLDKFMNAALRDHLVGDRIHTTFSPNKRDSGGTVTGRFASSHPNLQQVSAKPEKYGQQIRSLFLPEEGCMMGAFDYSQMEYLLLAHYAVGTQGDWLREQALNGVDFHKVAMSITGITDRPTVKRINFGVVYGMGPSKMLNDNRRAFNELGEKEGISGEEYVNRAFAAYHEKLHVVKDTMQHFQLLVRQQGYVTSIGGRVHHLPKPVFDPEKGRWNTKDYIITNHLIQGSGSDILKRGLLNAYEAGIFDVCPIHLTVHDENVVSIPYNKVGTEAAVELQQIMDNSFREEISVPMRSVGEVGPNWGYWASDIWEDMKNGIFDKETV